MGGLLGRMLVTRRADLASRGRDERRQSCREICASATILANVARSAVTGARIQADRARATWCWLTAMQLFGQAGLAEPLGDPLQLLLVLRARQCKRDRRKPAECRYPRVGASFQIRGELRARLVGATEQRVGRCQESMG